MMMSRKKILVSACLLGEQVRYDGEILPNCPPTLKEWEQLGWVILERNNLRLVPNDLVPGRTLYIPSIDGLKERGILP